jgi:hypothetical protein
MPIYQPPRNGVSISQAYAEAAVSAPVQRAMLHCYELWHPTLPEPIRIVNDNVPFFATLESTAPRDAGMEVEHLAAWLQASIFTESNEAASPEVQIRIDNVTGLLSDALAAARGSPEQWWLIERVYASDDPSGPAKLPVLSLTLTKASMSGPTAVLTSGYGDPVNVNIPSLTFVPEEYPGLSAQ